MAEHTDTSVADRHADLFALTSEERARLEALPFAKDPEPWQEFAGRVMFILLDSYATERMDFRQMLAIMRGCALGCSTKGRLMLVGMLADRALRITPAKGRRRKYPDGIKQIAASFVDFLRQVRPTETDKFQTILDESVAFLVTVCICDSAKPISTGTLHKWYLDRKRAAGDPITRGRPRDRA